MQPKTIKNDEEHCCEKPVSSVGHDDPPGLSSVLANQTATGGEGVRATATSTAANSSPSIDTTKLSASSATTTKKTSDDRSNKSPSSDVVPDLSDDVNDGEKSNGELKNIRNVKKQKFGHCSTMMEKSDAKGETRGTHVENLPAKSNLIVFLDLDMTMIYRKEFRTRAYADAYIASLPKHPKTKKTVEIVQRDYGTRVILLRPGIKEFLQKVSTTFETHIFTASGKLSAFEIASILDPNKKIFSEGNIWSHDHCEYKRVPSENCRLLPIKYLSKLPPVRDSNKGCKRAVLVDDWYIHMDASPMILVEEFTGDPLDNELDKVWKVLEALKDNMVDVPHILPTLLGNK